MSLSPNTVLFKYGLVVFGVVLTFSESNKMGLFEMLVVLVLLSCGFGNDGFLVVRLK